MKNRTVVGAFPPGDYIRKELEARGWTQLDLAEIIGRSGSIVNDIIAARRPITPEIANLLSIAFGTGAQVWLNLQSAYQLATAKSNTDDAAMRRAHLYDKVPVREITNRRWIEGSKDIDTLEAQVCEFLEIDHIDDKIDLPFAARKSTSYDSTNNAQKAWLMRARKMARSMDSPRGEYSGRRFNSMLENIVTLLPRDDQISNVIDALSIYGIRFLVIEPLPKTKIDGACFWLDDKSPVIALSLRYDRIDYFWHTLLHELAHVKQRDGMKKAQLDVAILEDDNGEKPASEIKADDFAVNHLVNQESMNMLTSNRSHAYSRQEIKGFAKHVGTHPGIVVGQLHHRGLLPYSHLRALLVKVREAVAGSAVTDGWGKIVTTH